MAQRKVKKQREQYLKEGHGDSLFIEVKVEIFMGGFKRAQCEEIGLAVFEMFFF